MLLDEGVCSNGVDPDPPESEVICMLRSGCMIEFRIRIRIGMDPSLVLFRANNYIALKMCSWVE
jgi:hypothetical protein